MAENQAEATTAEQTATEAEPHGDATGTTQTEATQPDTAIDWKAQAQKWEKLAKANHEKAEQADQLREKADQLQAQLDELNAAQAWEKTVGKVSGETGIPVDVLSIVKADSEDKLAEAAKMLQAFAQTGARRTGMGDQSRQPSEPRPSTEAELMSQVNRNATGA